jgi:ATP phosphoribosyltransferase regulatory subunit
MLEYLESLITGVAHDLDLATFKVVDQLTGRLMGIRADITPQAARIDAHMLNNHGVTRLCYAGSVLRTTPDGLAHTRQPMQLGAELFGHSGIEADIEIQRLMVKTLQAAGVEALQIDFSHVGIFDSLISQAKGSESLKQSIYQALQSKDQTEIIALTKDFDASTCKALCRLTELNGDADVLDAAAKDLPKTPEITKALNDLKQVASELADLGVGLSFDLAELRGYHYHSGMVFAAYAQGCSGPLAYGGRYDEVGRAFGRSRAATGFSLDLRGLIKAIPPRTVKKGILAPYGKEVSLLNKINSLRASGEKVVQELPGHEAYKQELNCDRKLVHQAGQWQVIAL